jgi:PAS domain-containing protein
MGGFLAEVGQASRRIEPVQVQGMDDAGSRAYADHHWQTDIWTPVGSVLPPGVMQIGDRLLPREAILRSEFYNDFLRHNGIGNFIGGILSNDDGRRVAISLYRPIDAPTVGDDEARRFEHLMPHLQRAIRIQSSINHARVLEAGLAGALDTLQFGVALLDEDGRSLFLNRAADAALARGDGLRLRLHRLGARDPASNTRFERAVRLATPTDGASAVASALSLPRHGSRFVWRTLVVPLPQARMPLVPNGRCLVWLIPGVARATGRLRMTHRLDAVDLDLLTSLRGGVQDATLQQLGGDEIARRLRRLADATGCEDADELTRAWNVIADPFSRATSP